MIFEGRYGGGAGGGRLESVCLEYARFKIRVQLEAHPIFVNSQTMP